MFENETARGTIVRTVRTRVNEGEVVPEVNKVQAERKRERNSYYRLHTAAICVYVLTVWLPCVDIVLCVCLVIMCECMSYFVSV